MLVLDEGDILSVTERGYGKRTDPEEHSRQGRGGQGVIGIQTSERNGRLISALQVTDEDDIMLISDGGTLVRTHANEISTLGRNTQGVTLIRLRDDENMVGVARIQKEEESEETPEDGEAQEAETPQAETQEDTTQEDTTQEDDKTE